MNIGTAKVELSLGLVFFQVDLREGKWGKGIKSFRETG